MSEQEEQLPQFYDVRHLGSSASGPSAPPPTELDDEADTLIANALQGMSIEEREQVYYKLHGVSDVEVEETPEFVNTKLEELQQEIWNLTTMGNHHHHQNLPIEAYRIAKSCSPQFVSDSKFRLGFLRRENYNTQKAAQRLIRYFDFKMSLFGIDQLCQDITYGDLGSDTDTLRNGFCQLLPERDRIGRPIIIFFPSQQYSTQCIGEVGNNWADRVGRIYFYLLQMVADDTLEKKGLVTVIYNVGPIVFEEFEPNVPPMFYRAFSALPTRIVSLHFCFDNYWFRICAQNVLKIYNTDTRAAGKLHYGSQQEVFYSLMTYGIPTNSFPVTFDNKIKRSNHIEMISMMRKKEQYTKDSNEDKVMQNGRGGQDHNLEYVIVPNSLDVLFGKGGPSQNSPGNIRLKMFLDNLWPQYYAMESKDEKANLVSKVIGSFKQGGGRFLSKDAGVWMTVPDDVTQPKIATMFRNRKKVAVQKRGNNHNNKTTSPAAFKTSRQEAEASLLFVMSNEGKRLRTS